MHRVTPYILVVDDESSMRAALAALLGDLGAEVVTAASGEEALRLLEDQTRHFALVLLDVHMPGLDGFETALQILHHDPPLHLPVIFLSGHATSENVLRGYREGAVDFLPKPFAPEILRSKVRVFLDLFLTREALAQREQFISAVVQTIPEMIYVHDVVEGRNLFLTGEVASILGYSPEEIRAMERSVMEALVHPEDLPGYRESMARIARAKDGEIQHHEFRMRHRDGSWKWIASRRRPFTRSRDGSLRTVVGAAYDITEQHQAREEIARLNTELEKRVEERTRALGEAEERLRLLVENVTDHAIIMTDPQGHILEWNPGAERIFGYSPAEVVGRSSSTLFTPEDRERGVPEGELEKAAATGKAVDDRWHIKQSGERFYASGMTTAVRDEQGELRGFAKICRDRTQDKLAQDALRESEERLQLVTDALPAFIAYIGKDLRYRFNNVMYEKWFGVPREQLAGRPLKEVLGEAVLRNLLPRIERVLRGERVQFRGAMALPLRTIEAETNLVPSFNEQGDVEGFVVLTTDITERAREERRQHFLLDASTALAASLDYEATLTRVTRMAVPALADWCAVDLLEENGEIRRLAAAHPDPETEHLVVELERRYPTRPDSDAGVARVIRRSEPLLLPDVSDEMLQSVARDAEHLALLRRVSIRSYLCVPLLARGRAIGALTFVSSDAERIRYGLVDLQLAEELARRAAAAIDNALLFRAVTEENAQRREAEARLANAHEEVLRASQAKSAFLSSMSHELRTPLNAIIGYSELLQEEMQEAGEKAASTDLARIESSARHLLALINDVLDMSKIEAGKVELHWEEVDVQKVVEEAVSMVGALAERNGNRIRTTCAGDVGIVRSDPTRLRQILFNLLSNAAKFTHNGSIAVECSRRRTDEEGRDWIELRVADTGPGIPEHEVGRLFEKFLQLDAGKKHGGTGLGLAITRLLARAMGGDVLVESRPGTGAIFTVRLPAHGAEEPKGMKETEGTGGGLVVGLAD